MIIMLSIDKYNEPKTLGHSAREKWSRSQGSNHSPKYRLIVTSIMTIWILADTIFNTFF